MLHDLIVQMVYCNGACAHYVMVSNIQWKPFWLATQLDPQNDRTGWQIRVNYDVLLVNPLLFRWRTIFGEAKIRRFGSEKISVAREGSSQF